MSTTSKRIQTIKVLVQGGVIAGNYAECQKITSELNAIENAKAVKDRKRRLLLQVLHTTRALDSSLRVCHSSYGIRSARPSLGGYLHDLTHHRCTGHAQLPIKSCDRFIRTIVDPRNRYMHTADAYPTNDNEVNNMLGEMHVCIAEVLAL